MAGAGRSGIKRFAGLFRRTPLHPQWLISRDLPSQSIRECHGVVLDVGSADRWLEPHLSSDATYIAFDFPATAVGLYGTRPDVFGDAHRLPFSEGSVDAVTCFEVLEHVRDPERVLSEISRVLVPGGVAELSMPFLYPIHDAPHDYQRWTSHGWSRSLAMAGLNVESLRPANHPLHASAVVAGLALTAPLLHVSRWSAIWRLPAVLALVPLINVAAWVLALGWPAWGDRKSVV